MTVYDPEYIQAFTAAERAALAWRNANPMATPKFRPITLPPGRGKGQLIATVEEVLAIGVARNGAARRLLKAIALGVPKRGATVLMAEYAIEQVFGIKSALTRQSPSMN